MNRLGNIIKDSIITAKINNALHKGKCIRISGNKELNNYRIKLDCKSYCISFFINMKNLSLFNQKNESLYI